MNWHEITSFALGFSLVPVVIGLVVFYAYLGIAFKLDQGLTAVGVVTGIVLFALVFAGGVGYVMRP